MELHYKGPRIDVPPDPWDEAFADHFHPIDAFLEADASFTYRLIPALRQAAQTMDPVQILGRAAEAFFFAANSTESMLDKRAATMRGNAYADLAVSGRMAYDAFKAGVDPAQILATTRDFLDMQESPPAHTDAQISAAVEQALDRAYDVAWALRGPPSQQADLRRRLGWIAVSGEDDKPHRPVNLPPPPYEQYEVGVTTNGTTLVTRFFIASVGAGPARTEARLPRTLPSDPPPPGIPADDEAILFLHGHSSGADEALALIPSLHEAGLARGKSYSILSLDLPNNGYSQTFEQFTAVAPLDATTYPKDPVDNTPIATPVLDFIEDFIADFLDALPTSITGRLVAVIGGSLGGNLALRLGRRDVSTKTWTIPAIVAWSPASVWPPKVQHVVDYLAPNTCFNLCGEAETAQSRDTFFFQSYEETHLLGAIKPQPEYWYRDNYVMKAFHVAQSRFGRFEIYNENFRRWHWRVAGEQLIYSHVDNVVHEDATTPLRYEANTVRMLLAVGAYDDYFGTRIYSSSIDMSNKMVNTPGRRLLMNTTGHSIHFERPRYFANEIVKFLNAQTRAIVCLVKEDDAIKSYGTKVDPTDAAEPVAQMTLDACVQAIEQGHEFYVSADDGTKAYVTVAHRERVPILGDPGGSNRGYHLKSVSDATTANNIETLKSCGQP